ncbi:NAD(P)/FAD-dependent oxidoreductase [Pandoraea sp. NPDC087047]|uniref:NAD(P)/FAD-dependent oxidoreductase n=1 Tax=Pandoraea sp. NPDC087047 TaxID=3364390 RepID=UPI00381DE0A7
MTAASTLAQGVPCGNPSPPSRAIVVGAGMAGLLAAHVLAGHFEEVCLLERDDLAEAPEPRPGVPQGHYVHLLMMQGLRTLTTLFPGLEQTLVEAGAVPVDWYRSVRWFGAAGWMKTGGEGFVTYSMSRNLLEFAVRQRVQAERRISVVKRCEVTGLSFDASLSRVCGVTFRHRAGTSSGHADNGTTLHADFVVDASGRNSRAPTWLTAAGYEAPRETVVNAGVGYASRLYEAPTRWDGRDWDAMVVYERPPGCWRRGTIFPIEGNRWIVTLTSAGGDHPPGDEAGFLDFTRSLPASALHDAIAVADPVSTIRQFRRTENRLRHYDKIGRWPAGFAVIGDAACSFNPVYGQGMTIAALSAVALDAHLHALRRSGDVPGSRALQRALARVARPAWILSTGVDIRQTGDRGPAHWKAQLMQCYVERLLPLAVEDDAIFRLFMRVMHMVEPPSALFVPSVAARVAWRCAPGRSRER